MSVRAAALAAALLLLPGSVASAAAEGAPPAASEGVARGAPPPAERSEARPWLERHLPERLLREGPQGLLWWQWLAIPGLAVVALALGAALAWLTRRVLGPLAARTRAVWDDALLERTAGPLTVLWAIAAVTALHPALGLGPGPESVLDRLLRAATYLALFWAGFRLADVAFSAASASSWTRSSPGLASLLPFGRKAAKVVLLALGVVAVLNELGFKVASLLAGLGIGGIALALAAQKTVENLFGSVAIGVDQPFREGDFVRIEDFVATVETIGMRSTRFRTLDRTIITIPNGRLSDLRAETFAVRDRLRLLANLGLVYGTTEAQLRAVLAGVEGALRAHPKIWPDAVSVRFNDFKDSSLNVEVMAWFQTADWNEFTAIRQELFLAFMRIVEEAGTAFAFPTRTVHLAGGDAAGKGAGPVFGTGPARTGGADRDRTDDL
jgi:MscS family membrane protein